MRSLAQLGAHVAQLSSAVAQADHRLDGITYPQVRALFDRCRSSAPDATALRQLAPEYGREEYLLPVDRTGAAVHPPRDVVEAYRAAARQHPAFGQWLQETPLGGEGWPVLLAARWLCHLVGFRHRSVELFLDHPAADEYTLLQVRSLNKVEAPGCFDLPAAGHIAGIAPPGDALFQELEEELGLTLADVCDVRPIGSYDHTDPVRRSGLRNAEYRAVFAGRLRAGALSRIRFVDGEVAAVALFSRVEIQMLLNSRPERVASGLAHSWSFYLAAREGQI
jgi:8-oxo-dGTP pyrophosphatase MutT (NUDIX family)